MFAPFEKEYRTPMEFWSSWRRVQAIFLYSISLDRYKSIALQAKTLDNIVENIRTVVGLARQIKRLEQLENVSKDLFIS